MSEYRNVEQPFLNKLRQLGWTAIDQGPGVPSDPFKSHRRTFREVTLEKIFKESIKAINKTDDGKEWLSEKQLDEKYRELVNFSGQSLLEANRQVHTLFTKGSIVEQNELTKQKSPPVRFIDFSKWENN